MENSQDNLEKIIKDTAVYPRRLPDPIVKGNRIYQDTIKNKLKKYTKNFYISDDGRVVFVNNEGKLYVTLVHPNTADKEKFEEFFKNNGYKKNKELKDFIKNEPHYESEAVSDVVNKIVKNNLGKDLSGMLINNEFNMGDPYDGIDIIKQLVEKYNFKPLSPDEAPEVVARAYLTPEKAQRVIDTNTGRMKRNYFKEEEFHNFIDQTAPFAGLQYSVREPSNDKSSDGTIGVKIGDGHRYLFLLRRNLDKVTMDKIRKELENNGFVNYNFELPGPEEVKL